MTTRRRKVTIVVEEDEDLQFDEDDEELALADESRRGRKAPPTPCETCDGQCPVMPSGCFDRPEIAFVGEAPGEEEAERGEPFVGRAGKLLRQVSAGLGIPLDRVYYNNALMWRPPDNRNPRATEIEACRPRLLRDLIQVRPKIIVPLGNFGAQGVLGKGTAAISHVRGIYRTIELDGRNVHVLPTLHPAGIFRQPDAFMDFADDLTLVTKLLAGETPVVEPPYENYLEIRTQRMFDALIRRLWSVEHVALDLETTHLIPEQGDILSIGFTWERESSAILDWQTMIEGNDANYEALREVLNEHCKVIAHNSQFDLLWLASRGIIPKLAMDTMLAHFTLDERQGSHGLKRLSISRYRSPEYDTDLKAFMKEERKRLGITPPEPIATMKSGRKRSQPTASGGGQISIGDSDRKEPLRLSLDDWAAPTIRERIAKYNGADADFTWRLFQDLRPEMVADGVAKVHDDIMLPAVEHFIALEQDGLLVDVEYHNDLGARWQAELDAINDEMNETPGASEVLWTSHVQVKKFLFQTLGLRQMPHTGEELKQSDLLREIQAIEDPEAQEHWRASSAHVRAKMKPDSTNSYMLYWLAQQHPIPRLLVRRRLVEKKIGTYYDGYRNIMRAGDRIHPRYRLHGTRTGRLSSTDPNIHAMPRLKEIKRIFIADPGYVLIAPDYSQAEIRMLAHLSGDEGLIKQMDEADIHRATSRDLFGVTDEELDTMDPERKEFMRRAAKQVNFGINYRISAKSLAPQLGISVKEAEIYIAKKERTMPQAMRWMAERKRQVVAEREVQSLFGNKRRFPIILDKRHLAEVERQVINMPIQNAVSHMTLLANIRIIRQLEALGTRKGMRPVMVWPHIHDGFLFQVREDLYDRAMEMTIAAMHEVPFETRVKFAVEIKVGPNWGELKSVYEG